LGAVAEARAALAETRGDHPVFLKIAPDLHESAVGDITDAAVRFGLDGLIVSNTTVTRPASLVSAHRGQAGGLSGVPLMEPSTRILGQFHDAAAGRLILIGVGGIASGADAYAKIRAGAHVVQLYSALAYDGPALVTAIKHDLAARLRADGFMFVEQAVGAR
jgi:dihydroorotate dehydrogenase